MNHCILLYASVFLLSFVREGGLEMKVTIKSVSPLSTSSSSTQSSRRAYSMVKKFKLSKDEVTQLRGVRSDIALLVATFVTRETFKTTPPSSDWITNKLKRRPSRMSYPNRRTKLTSKCFYKKKRTYPSHKDRRVMMYNHFVNIFSNKDKEKELFLTNMETPPKKSTLCYLQVYSCFTEYCFYEHYWKFIGLKLMQDLLARACTAKWLTQDQITYTLQKCCEKRFKYKPVAIF